jgi:hypothetical protein
VWRKKQILPEALAKEPSRRARFEQEAGAVAALNHPNIVAIYDVGDGDIVSELVDGEPLRGGKPGLRRTIEIAGQIAAFTVVSAFVNARRRTNSSRCEWLYASGRSWPYCRLRGEPGLSVVLGVGV